MAVLPLVAPLALAAHHIVLDEDQIAFLEALAARKLASRLGDVADILMAHDGRRIVRRRLVELHVGAADAGDFHLQKRRVVRDLRHRIFADFHLARPRADRRQYLFRHLVLLSPRTASGPCEDERRRALSVLS
jgi:hypothetical protein